jgi:hypothetical protein
MGALFAGVFGVIAACAAVVLLSGGTYLLIAAGPLGWLVLVGMPVLFIRKLLQLSRKPAKIDVADHFPPGYVSPGGSVGTARPVRSVEPEPVVPVIPLRKRTTKPAPRRTVERRDDLPEPGYFL